MILQRGRRLQHMHLHDVVQGQDHRALGTGELDKEKYLALAEQHGCTVVLETKTIAGLKESVQWLKTRK